MATEASGGHKQGVSSQMLLQDSKASSTKRDRKRHILSVSLLPFPLDSQIPREFPRILCFQFSAWYSCLGPSWISQKSTEVLFTYSPSPISNPFLFILAPHACQPKYFSLPITFQTGNNAISFASKMCSTSAHFSLFPLPQPCVSHCCLPPSPTSPVTWSPVSDFHTLSTIIIHRQLSTQQIFFKDK